MTVAGIAGIGVGIRCGRVAAATARLLAALGRLTVIRRQGGIVSRGLRLFGAGGLPIRARASIGRRGCTAAAAAAAGRRRVAAARRTSTAPALSGCRSRASLGPRALAALLVTAAGRLSALAEPTEVGGWNLFRAPARPGLGVLDFRRGRREVALCGRGLRLVPDPTALPKRYGAGMLARNRQLIRQCATERRRQPIDNVGRKRECPDRRSGYEEGCNERDRNSV